MNDQKLGADQVLLGDQILTLRPLPGLLVQQELSVCHARNQTLTSLACLGLRLPPTVGLQARYLHEVLPYGQAVYQELEARGYDGTQIITAATRSLSNMYNELRRAASAKVRDFSSAQGTPSPAPLGSGSGSPA